MTSKKEGLIHYYKSRSFWLETSGESLVPRPGLEGSETFDVAIMGAGYSGLWTAYYLAERDPSLKIAIIEKEIAGFGASGRNGGWCSPTFPVSPSVAIKRYGLHMAQNLYKEMFNTITEFERIINKEKLDVDWEKSGSIIAALGVHGLPSLNDSVAIYKKLGLEEEFELFDEMETSRRVNIAIAKGSLFTKNSAVLHPGKLSRKLASLLENRGVHIFEQTEIIDIVEGTDNSHPKFITLNGEIVAKKSLVVTGEAYLSKMNQYRRKVIPMYSLINLTEPLTDNQWNQIGWYHRETVGSTRYSVNYLQRTADGRILMGGRGQPYRYQSKIADSLDQHEQTNQNLRNMLIKWFPMLDDIKITHTWGGPVGITRDWTPNFTYDQKKRIAQVYGYGGQGVATANLAGRIVADLITNTKSELTDLPMVQHHSRKWEIEPFRWLGARFVQQGLERVDKIAETTGRPPTGKTLAERLGHH